jgi:acyl carrier protein
MENFNEIIAEILEVESVEPDNELASFEAWDSLTVLSIIAFCDSDYGVALSADEVDSAETIAGLKDLIEGKL